MYPESFQAAVGAVKLNAGEGIKWKLVEEKDTVLGLEEIMCV